MTLERQLMKKKDLGPRQQELFDLLQTLNNRHIPLKAPAELGERIETITSFFGPVTSGEIRIAKSEFLEDAIARWIVNVNFTEIDWPKLE